MVWRSYHDAMWNQSRRLADLVIAAALLIFASPLIGFVTLAIRWEGPGPIFERQTCIARGRRFQMLNFRTTVPDPEHKIPVWTRSPTPVGEVLRYTRIECLPQLINVVRGDITLAELAGSSPSFLD